MEHIFIFLLFGVIWYLWYCTCAWGTGAKHDEQGLNKGTMTFLDKDTVSKWRD